MWKRPLNQGVASLFRTFRNILSSGIVRTWESPLPTGFFGKSGKRGTRWNGEKLTESEELTGKRGTPLRIRTSSLSMGFSQRRALQRATLSTLFSSNHQVSTRLIIPLSMGFLPKTDVRTRLVINSKNRENRRLSAPRFLQFSQRTGSTMRLIVHS